VRPSGHFFEPEECPRRNRIPEPVDYVGWISEAADVGLSNPDRRRLLRRYHKMPCDEWRNLVTRYRTAVYVYNAAVDHLGDKLDASFIRTWQLAESARKNTDSARAALLLHEHDHACLVDQSPSARNQIQDLAEDLILGNRGQSGG
jgi:hypothetical protein